MNANNNKMEDIVTTAQEWAKNNQSQIRGYGFLILGTFLLYLTFKIIINMLLFLAGIFLLYDGCKRLNCSKITDFFDRICSYIKCNCNSQ